MSAITIRRAVSGDREAICRLYHEFHEFHVRGVKGRLLSLGEPPDTYEHSDLYQTLASIIADDNSVIFLAETAGQLVGLAELYLRQDDPNPLRKLYRYGHLQSMIVTQAFRRKGIGTSLLEAAHKWAREKGAIEMRLDIWEFGEGPLVFYENNDYRTLRRTLVRDL